jgi:plasmid stabilization system protein ParE
MTSTVLFKRAARAEISNIAEYLEEQRPGFGRRFIDEIKRVEDLLRDNPAQYQRLHNGTRRAVLRRFPYGLFYVVEGDKVSVLACFHLHRGPLSYSDLIAR